ncbi:response regulator transcription factor [Hymenobacter wooponensis]|uniref:Response regulator transcription factor n=1 Tax=Hymenobacter wooponensis TaxID=1525360 RepID=A0A4Z0MDW7_9BACT|nr:response regulator transcription factor [Hymenobacter wooponensis]TGD77659.1 response regulator transcription factor [Hymenobacter wooponensis]
MIRILLADDHPVARIGMRLLVAQQPDLCVAGEVSTGAQVLEWLAHSPAEVVVLDRIMPGQDVLTLLTQLPAGPAAPRVLVLSTEATPALVAAIFTAGASGYIDKTSTHEELLLALRLVAAGRPYLSPERGLQALRQLPAATALPALPAPFSPQPAAAASRQPAEHGTLSAREHQVLHLLVLGYTNAEIAAQLLTSKRTVETYRERLLEKTGTRNTATLVRYALQQGLVN